MEKYTIMLSLEERDELLKIATRGNGFVANARRASILLAIDRRDFADLRLSDA